MSSSAAAAWVEVDRLRAEIARYIDEVDELKDALDRRQADLRAAARLLETQRARIADLEART